MSDKFLTKSDKGQQIGPRKKKRGAPICTVRQGSASVPIYAGPVNGKTRYTIAFYRNGQRVRRMFTKLDDAKREAKIAAANIQKGYQENNDLRPAERDAYLAATGLLKDVSVPLVSAIEEYAECRKRLGDVPLLSAVDEFLRRMNGVTIGVTVPDAVKEFIEAKEQDGMSKRYKLQLQSTLGLFAKAFPGSKSCGSVSDQIDRWLRESRDRPGHPQQPAHRGSRLPEFRQAARLSCPSPKQLRPIPCSEGEDRGHRDRDLSAGGHGENCCWPHRQGSSPTWRSVPFAGLRSAELSRLDWSAVDLDRRMIELRAGSGKDGLPAHRPHQRQSRGLVESGGAGTGRSSPTPISTAKPRPSLGSWASAGLGTCCAIPLSATGSL